MPTTLSAIRYLSSPQRLYRRIELLASIGPVMAAAGTEVEVRRTVGGSSYVRASVGGLSAWGWVATASLAWAPF